jgi:hypothetical protein
MSQTGRPLAFLHLVPRAQIGAQLGMTEDAVRCTLARGQSKIRKALEDMPDSITRVNITSALSIKEFELEVVRQLEVEAARAASLAAEARLPPRIVAEARLILHRIHTFRLLLQVAYKHLVCGSVECHPEHWGAVSELRH